MSEHQKMDKKVLLLSILMASMPFSHTYAATSEAEVYLKQAQEYLDKNNIKAAVIELKNALQEDPSYAEGRFLLGKTYLGVGDGPSAEKELLRARALGMEGVELDLNLAEAYLQLKKFDEAIEQSEPYLDASAEYSARALTLNAMGWLGKGDIEQARSRFEQALEAEPNGIKPTFGLVQVDLASNNLDAALQKIDALVKAHPDNFQSWLIKGELERKGKRIEDSYRSYSRAIELKSNDPNALLGRATVNISRGQLAEAKEDLAKVDQLVKGLVMSEYLRALIAYQEKRYGEARDHLQKVLSAAPGNIQAQMLMGVVSYIQKDYQLADEYLSRIVADFPNHTVAAKILGASRIKIKEPKRAIAVLEPLVDKSGADFQLFALLGSAYLMQGEYAKGNEYLQKAVEMQPGQAALHTQLALGLIAGGENQQAVSELQSAVDLDQDLLQADVLLVLMKLREKDYEQALVLTAALQKRMPKSPIPYNLEGLAYAAKGEFEQARKRFKQALSIDPDFTTAELNLARVELKRQDYSAAKKYFQAVVKKQSTNAAALIGLASLAEREGDKEEMIRLLRQANDGNANNAQPGILLANHYLKENNALKALSVANDLSSRFPNNVKVLEVLGKAQLSSGEPNSAVRTFARLVAQQPIAPAYLLLGGAQLAAKDANSGKASIEKALELDPNNVRGLMALGTIELKSGNNQQALALAKRLQQTIPEKAGGYELEGMVYAVQNDTEGSIAAFENAYKREKSAGSARQLAKAYYALDRREDAMAIMLDWLDAAPSDLASRLVLAMSLQKWGMNDKSIEQYRLLKESQPDNVIVLNNLAWLYFLKNDARALDTAQRAYDLDAKRAEVADTYGWILLKMGDDPEKALQVLQQAYVNFPTSSEIGYHVAVALHEVKRDKEAVRTLRKVIWEGESFDEIEQAKALLKSLGG